MTGKRGIQNPYVIVKCHKTWYIPYLVGLCFCFKIYFECVTCMLQKASFNLRWKCFPPPPPKKSVILNPYLPITATSLQQPLSSVPKVALWRSLTVFTRHVLTVQYLKYSTILTLLIILTLTVQYNTWREHSGMKIWILFPRGKHSVLQTIAACK